MYTFLSLEEIVAEQERQLAIYGGGFPGIINQGTLESAWAAPQHGFGDQYFHEDVFAMAAATLVGFVKGHAFANGNKRIGLAAALEFLYVNGYLIEASNDEAVELVLGLIANTTTAADAAAFFRSKRSCRCHPSQAAVDCVESVIAVGEGEARAQLLAAAVVWVHGKYADAFAVLAL
jgi:death on curing protein